MRYDCAKLDQSAPAFTPLTENNLNNASFWIKTHITPQPQLGLQVLLQIQNRRTALHNHTGEIAIPNRVLLVLLLLTILHLL